MKISLEWISQYIEGLTATPEDIAHQLTMSTAEVEGVEELHRAVEGVVVGEIVDIKPIPGHPHVKQLTVDCGERKYATVCGAPNVRLNLKIAFAPAGTRIATGALIEEGTMSGCLSQGIVCSAMELGFSEFHEIALEIPNFGLQSQPQGPPRQGGPTQGGPTQGGPTVNGTPLAALVPAHDFIIEIDNKSLTHRPDLWGHYGIAREVAAIYGLPLKPLAQVDLAQFAHLPAYPLRVEDFENCPAYGCIDLRNIEPSPSPLFMQWRLHAVGQRSMDILVDLTNYIMFEIGQPTHAFDGDKLQAVRVAPMGAEEDFITLDGLMRRMTPDDLMIWNEKEPVAIAGVMGGQSTEVTPQTKRLLLESANFKGSRIRRTAVRLNLRSEASQRFEKNQPPRNTKIAVGRFLELLHEAGHEPEVLSRLTMAGELHDAMRSIEFSEEFFRNRVGKAIPRERVQAILHSLGFELEFTNGTMRVGVPPFRGLKDISIPEDIVEEVSRIYGFGNIEPVLPDIPMPQAHFNDRLRTEHKARRLLAQAHSFAELHLYSWFDDNWLKTIGWEPGPTLALRNPAAEQCRRMRTTLLPNLLAAVAQNQLNREDFRLFELGHVYEPLGEKDRKESVRLAGASYARAGELEAQFREMKGALEDLGRMLGGEDFIFEESGAGAAVLSSEGAPWLAAGASIAILRGGRVVGAMGFITGALREEVAPKGQAVWFELDFDALDGPIFPDLRYAPPSPFPGSWFDVSLVWPTEEGFAALASKLDQFQHPLIISREFLLLYKGKGLEPGMGSYSFRYRIGSRERTLAGEEIEALQQGLFGFLKAEGMELR